MMTQKIRTFSRWCAVAAFALPSLNLTAQAQRLQTPNLATVTPSIWQEMPTPNPGGDNLVLSLSADSETDIWAVGDFIALNFDGQTWNAIPLSPLPGQSSMNGVAAISPTDIWAVGSSEVSNGAQSHVTSVIEHYDGTQWTIVPSPQFSSGSELKKVQAFSANDIFAVGDSNTDSQHGVPLVEHFDGTEWSVIPTPLKKGQTTALSGISGLSSSDFWVIGNTQPIAGTAPTAVVAHFDGQHFTQVPFPDQGSSISGVTEIANNDAWIVGTSGSTLTAHWDGKNWTVVPSPGVGKNSSLTGVSAISSTNVWASGSFSDSAPIQNLVEHWDGKTWTISPIASAVGGFDAVRSVLAFPSGSVFVAGFQLACIENFCAGFEPAIFHTTQGLNQ